jgi:hypothetical protein
MEVVPDRESRRCSRRGGGIGLGDSHPGGPTRRRERWSTYNRSGRSDRDDRGWPHGPCRWRTSPARSRTPNEGRMRSAEAETRTQRVRPLPRLRGGPQSPSFRTRRKSRGRTGIWRVRVLVVRDLGSRHRTNVSVGAFSAARCKARRRKRYLARRKLIPGGKIS